MKPYSEDLRERIAAACAAGDSSLGQVADRFSGSLSFVNKLLKRQRTSGSLAALPHRGGPSPLLDAAARTQLAACVARQPDATLEELRVHLAASGGPAVAGRRWRAGGGGPAVGRTTGWQGLQALDLRRKKSASTPPSAPLHE
jgi:transposase